MLQKLITSVGLVIGIMSPFTEVGAMTVSSDDLWQNAQITTFSSQHHAGPMSGFFDGLEGGYGYETGNALFSDGMLSGTVHFIEWETSAVVTLNSFNLVAYHDFDDRDIEDRGFGQFSLFSGDGTTWNEIFTWNYNDPHGDLHYGGGPSYHFDPDPHDMNRSYLELTQNLSETVSSRYFRAEFTQYGTGGPRVVELDGYAEIQSIPLPASLTLLLSGLIVQGAFVRAGKKRTTR